MKENKTAGIKILHNLVQMHCFYYAVGKGNLGSGIYKVFLLHSKHCFIIFNVRYSILIFVFKLVFIVPKREPQKREFLTLCTDFNTAHENCKY